MLAYKVNSLIEITMLEVQRVIIILKRLTVSSGISWPIHRFLYTWIILYFLLLAKYTMCFCTLEEKMGKGGKMERNWMVSRCDVNVRP